MLQVKPDFGNLFRFLILKPLRQGVTRNHFSGKKPLYRGFAKFANQYFFA